MRARTVVAVAGLVAGAAFVPQGAARAQTYCSPGTLRVCTAFTASTAKVSGTWHLYLHVWNLYDGSAANGLSHVVTFAGIGSSWTGTANLASAKFGGAAVKWKIDNSPNNNVVGAAIDAGAATQSGITNGLVGCSQPMPPGKYQTCYPNGPELDLDFTTSSQFTLAGAVYGWHSQAVNASSCSLWADSQGNSTNTSIAGCGSVVPEPVTMTLLATGLASMGGVGFLRRRRRGLEEDGRAV
jgi:hypothetical protein